MVVLTPEAENHRTRPMFVQVRRCLFPEVLKFLGRCSESNLAAKGIAMCGFQEVTGRID
jgi:hypothetical protein